MRAIFAIMPRWILAALVLVPAATTIPARAAGPRDAGTIPGQGQAAVKKFPTTLRMTLSIPGKGKTVEEALADLKQRRQAAFEKLEKLGAQKKSLHAETPAVVPAPSGGRSFTGPSFSSMPRLFPRSGKIGAKTIKVPQSVTVMGMIRADWPVASKDPDSLFLEMHKLGKTIEAAKLAGDEATAKLSPEEREQAEEMGIPPDAIAEMAGVSTGSPSLVCLARITAKERQEAMAEAVNKARSDAARKAQAAGYQLGPLVHLVAQGGGGRSAGFDFEDPSVYMMRPEYLPYLQSMRYGMARFAASEDEEEGEEPSSEASSREPGPVRFSFSATATFLLAEPAAKGGP
jgi:hypothetical protein